MKQNQYIPALKYSWLTRFYDPVVAFSTREKAFRKALLEQAKIKPDDRVLDLGCGTGTFAVMIKTRYPDTSVRGLDGDPGILIQAEKKAGTAGVHVDFDESMSYSTPYSDDSFDVVFSSLFFHHLKSEDKTSTMREVFRMLRPGGEFHVCDWGQPSNPFSKFAFMSVRLLDGFEVTRDNYEGRLPAFIEDIGFDLLTEHGHIETMLGTLDFLSARKPLG